MKRILFLLIGCLCLCGRAEASCSGSGLTWSCTAGSTASQINTAISSASNNAVITLAAGTYTDTGYDVISGGRNGITIICAGTNTCIFNGGGTIFLSDYGGGGSGNKTNLIRVSGMKFTGSNGIRAFFWVIEFGATWSKVRIDNNLFVQAATGDIQILFGGDGRYGSIYGVVDHNTFGDGTDANSLGFKNIQGGESTDWLTGAKGQTTGNMFFETNTCNFATDDPSAGGCIESWKASGLVFRFNTLTNSRYVTHSYCHDGPFNQELLYNTIQQPDACAGGCPQYRNVHWQGSGEIISLFNTIYQAPDPANTEVLQEFRSDATQLPEGSCTVVSDGTVTGSGADPAHPNDGNRTPLATYRGYPTWHQAGRDINGKMMPIYIVHDVTETGVLTTPNVDSGTWTGSAANCGTGSNLVNCHLQLNRDIYESVSKDAQTSATSPFNGTSGVGHGTLANRPTTCTTTPESLDAGNGGVAYWATDVGAWRRDQTGASGRLYVCTATNTWTLYYTPAQYPHFLIPDSGTPASPTNPRTP